MRRWYNACTACNPYHLPYRRSASRTGMRRPRRAKGFPAGVSGRGLPPSMCTSRTSGEGAGDATIRDDRRGNPSAAATTLYAVPGADRLCGWWRTFTGPANDEAFDAAAASIVVVS